MLEMTIFALESLTVFLVALLFLRLRQLASATNHTLIDSQVAADAFPLVDEPILVEAPTTEDYEQKMHCLKLAQAFTGNQMLDIKRAFPLQPAAQPEWLRQAVSLYLIGAIDFIGKQHDCQNSSRKELIEIVLKSNLKINRDKAKAFFVEAVCREPKSDNDNMVIAGAIAAKSWLENQLVPENVRLANRVQDWGIVA